MKAALLSIVICSGAVFASAQSPESTIRAYLTGFGKKDWGMTAAQFAPGFTFTSPAGDDHISLEAYRKKCWPTSRFFRTMNFSKIMVQGDNAFAIYNITTTENKTVHNVEYYAFSNGKIRSIECFFGAGTGYPGNKN